jgi:glycosyltransferase involved in cell wall biosynthesis
MVRTVSPHVLIMPPGHVRTSLSPSGGVFQFDLGFALQERGFKVGMVSVSKSPVSAWLKNYKYPPREDVSGIPLYRRYPRTILPASLDGSMLIGKHLTRHVSEIFEKYFAEHGKPDLIHAHNIKYAAFLSEKLSKYFRVPYVYTEHSSEILSKSVSTAMGALLRRVVENSSGTSAVSSALRTAMCEISGLRNESIEVIPNMLPIDFETLGSRDECRNREYRFLNVAEALPVKRQAFLIKAFAKYFKDVAATLTIVGDGPELKSLVNLSASLGVSSQVTFLGRLRRSEIRNVLLRSDCFVLSSRHETFAVAAIEALSQGVPVVSTRCGGPNEFINEKNGVFANSDTVDGLGEAMIAARNRRDLFDSEIISRQCIETYAANVVIDSYSRFYTRAIAS